MKRLKHVQVVDLDNGIQWHNHPEVIQNYDLIVELSASDSGGDKTDLAYLSGRIDQNTYAIDYLSGEIDLNTDDIYQIINEDITMTGDKTVYGDVIVHGTFYALSAVIITTEEFALSSNFIDLNNNWTSGVPIEDAGIRVRRGDEPYAEIRWDETNNYWTVGVIGDLDRVVVSGDIIDNQLQIQANAADIAFLSGEIDNNYWDIVQLQTDIDYLSGQIDTYSDHANLSGLEWSNAGHTIDTDVDYNAHGIYNISGITFDGPVDPAYKQLSWDNDFETLAVGSLSGSTNSVGYEDWTKVYNNTGSTIYNGQPVAYSNAVSGDNWPTVYLSQAGATGANVDRRSVYGIATQDIPNNTPGIITNRGRINDVNTSAWVLGTELYLSETMGELTTTKPLLPSSQIRVGIVTNSHAVSGKFDVRVEDLSWVGASQAANASKEKTGFTLNDSGVAVDVANLPLVLSGEPISRTFKIIPTAGTFAVFSNDNLFYKSGTQETTWTDVEGDHYFYFDNEGELQHSTTYDDSYLLGPDIYCAYLYWNATSGEIVLEAPLVETHGLQMDGATHLHFHNVLGAQVDGSGLALNSFDIDGSGDTNSHAQFGVDTGIISDEDLKHTISAVSSLSGMHVVYFDGAAGNLREFTETGYSVIPDTTAGIGSTGLPVYNEWTGSTWQLTTVPNGDYFLCHVFAIGTAAGGDDTYVVMGQDTYGSTRRARNGADVEMGNIVSTLPFPEIRPIGTVIFQTGNGYTNAVKSATRSRDGNSYIDWRKDAIPAGAGFTPSDHNNLSNRDATNAHPADAIATDITNFNRILDTADTDVQLALDSLDNEAAKDTDVNYLSGVIDDNSDAIDSVNITVDALSAVNVDTKEPTGFNLDAPTTIGDISFDDGTLTFTIEPQGGETEFYFYQNGTKYVKTLADTTTITDTEGLWFIYYDENITLTASQTPWSFGSNKTFVAILYWDATNSKAVIGEERHGIAMDHDTHEYLHNTVGAVYKEGFTPSLTVDGDGSLDAHAEMQSIAAGKFYDEDILNSNDAQTTYEIWYKDGASTDWRWDTASAALVKIATRPYYNEFTGGAWQLTEVSNTDFTLTHIFATNRVGSTNKIIFVMGENEYATVGAARTGAETEIFNITTGSLPTPEFIPIATVIVQCRDNYTNAYNARVRSTNEGDDFIDWRVNDKIGVGGIASDHGNLVGLGEDDHLQYSLVDGTRSFTGTVGGITPVVDSDLATKGYVDSADAYLSGQIDSNTSDISTLSASLSGESLWNSTYSTVKANSGSWGGEAETSWLQLVNSWTLEPTLNTTIASGEVYDYTYGSTVYYRLVPDPYNSTEDKFYSYFSDPVISGVITTRGEAI